MADYTLTLLIDSKIIQKQPTDNLNIARKVNDVFTTTFQGASINPIDTQRPLMEINVFHWSEEYAAFPSVEYSHGMHVLSASKAKPIKFGQQITYENGVLTEAEPADPSKFGQSNPNNAFLLCGVPNNLRASVSCKVGQKWAPIYVDNRKHNGVIDKQMTPLNSYALFWDSMVTTSTMIDYSKSTKPFEFSFEGNEKMKTLRYGFRTQDSPVGTEQPEWYPVSLQ